MDFFAAPASYSIILITSLISLYVMFLDPAMFNQLVLHPYSIIKNNRWHTIITSGFIHSDLFHLLFNMMTFYFFAVGLEGMIGAKQILIIYLGSMILADIPTIFRNQNDYNYTAVGASGGVAGLLFGFILYAPMAKIGMILLPFRIPAWLFGILYLAWCFYADTRSIGRSNNDRLSGGNINHSAHLWGSVAGIFLTVMLNPPVIKEFFAQIMTYFH